MALFLKNSVEHVTSLLGLIKIRAVPVNINYRYTNTELHYIFENSDSVGIIVELPEHQRSVAELLPTLPLVRTVFVIGAVTDELRDAVAALPGGSQVTIASFADAESLPRNAISSSAPVMSCTCCTPEAPPDTRRASCGADDFFRKPLSGGNPYGDDRRTSMDRLGRQNFRRWHSCWPPADARRRIVFAVHLLHPRWPPGHHARVQPGRWSPASPTSRCNWC